MIQVVAILWFYDACNYQHYFKYFQVNFSSFGSCTKRHWHVALAFMPPFYELCGTSGIWYCMDGRRRTRKCVLVLVLWNIFGRVSQGFSANDLSPSKDWHVIKTIAAKQKDASAKGSPLLGHGHLAQSFDCSSALRVGWGSLFGNQDRAFLHSSAAWTLPRWFRELWFVCLHTLHRRIFSFFLVLPTRFLVRPLWPTWSHIFVPSGYGESSLIAVLVVRMNDRKSACQVP